MVDIQFFNFLGILQSNHGFGFLFLTLKRKAFVQIFEVTYYEFWDKVHKKLVEQS